MFKKESYPNLLIIGAMKCGTSSLHDYLNLHPDIYMSDPKEIHYYDNLSKLTSEEYLSYFKSNKKIIGTTPQNYTKAHHEDFKGIAEKIHSDTPNVKLIYIVRDPFKRIQSHVVENKFGSSKTRIELNKKNGHYWKTSLYYYQISEYLRYFNKDQIHVLTLESLQKNKLNELNHIFRFLGVSEMKDESIFDFIKNETVKKDIPLFIQKRIWYRAIVKVYPKLAVDIWKLKKKVLYKNYHKKPLLSQFIDNEVAQLIIEDSNCFHKEFNIDISDWNLNVNL